MMVSDYKKVKMTTDVYHQYHQYMCSVKISSALFLFRCLVRAVTVSEPLLLLSNHTSKTSLAPFNIP